MRLFTLVILAGAACVPSLARAEIRIVNETQVMQAAMQVSPDFQSVLRDEAIDKADADQEFLFENPTIDFSTSRTSGGDNDSNSYDIEIEQPLKISQLTGTRVMLANSLFERAEIRRQHGILQAYWNTKQLYAQAWQYQQQAKLYADFQKRARETAASMNKSMKAGQTAVSDASLFAGDAAKFGSDLERIEAQKAQVLLQLEKVTGMSLAAVELENPALNEVSEDVAMLEKQARENASLVRLLEADLKAAERHRRAAIADSAAPQIAPRFIYGRDDSEDSVGVGVVLTIPLWDRNQTERRKADAERAFAQRQLDTLQTLPLSQRLAGTIDAIQRLDKRIVLLEKDALPNYRKGFSQAQKSFGAGQTDAAALWQIRERLFETERDLLEATLDAVDARRVLSLETGTMPQEAF